MSAAPMCLDAQVLAIAVGILRQQPDAGGGSMLTERLQALLDLAAQRPGRGGGGADAEGEDASSALAVAAEVEGFWMEPDEWADVRAALMAVDEVSIDEEDEEDASQLEGEDRPRVLQRLPRLDGASAAQLAALLSLLRERRERAAGGSGDGASAVAAAAGGGGAAASESWNTTDEEEAEWWEKVEAAFKLLAAKG